MKIRQLGGAWMAALAIVAGTPAVARNTEHLLPIQSTLATPEARAAIGNDIPVSFGAALPDGRSIVNDRIVSRGNVDPRPVFNRPGNVRQLTDEEACAASFIAALKDLVEQARKAGGTSLVGIVSNYDGKERDSTEVYECHAGSTRVIVELKAVVTVAGTPGVPTLVRNGSVSNLHRGMVPPASGYADAAKVDAVPLSDAGKARYRHYLTLPSPKAFVVYEGGAWRFYYGDVDAITKALDFCKQEGKACSLYAVDHRVVWNADPAKRYSTSSQLGNE